MWERTLVSIFSYCEQMCLRKGTFIHCFDHWLYSLQNNTLFNGCTVGWLKGVSLFSCGQLCNMKNITKFWNAGSSHSDGSHTWTSAEKKFRGWGKKLLGVWKGPRLQHNFAQSARKFCAKCKKISARNASQIARKRHFKAYLPHINREYTLCSEFFFFYTFFSNFWFSDVHVLGYIEAGSWRTTPLSKSILLAGYLHF